MEILVCLITAVCAYFLGSIPSGYLAGRAKGVDVRKSGSGNIGATNAFRVLGVTAGIIVLVADGMKGWLAVSFIPELMRHFFSTQVVDDAWYEYLKVIAGIGAILGHNYTCWLNFKGGKGIATSAGVLAALAPLAFVTSLTTFIIVCFLSRYVSLASIAAALVLPFATWFWGYSLRMIVITGLIGALAIFKHKANIGRLVNGTENKIGRKKPVPEQI